MSSQDPLGSTVPPERPTNPTHFGGEGLYDSKPDPAAEANDASLKVPLGEQMDDAARESLVSEQTDPRSLWDFARRNHLLTLLAVGGLVWLLRRLLGRSTKS